MNMFDVGLDGWNIIYVKLNWVVVIILLLIILFASFMQKNV